MNHFGFFKHNDLKVSIIAALALLGSLFMMKAQANSIYYSALNDAAMYDKAQAMLSSASELGKEKANVYVALQSNTNPDEASDLALQYAGSVLKLTNPTLANAMGIDMAPDDQEDPQSVALMDDFEPFDDLENPDGDDGVTESIGKAIQKTLETQIKEHSANLEDSDSFKVNFIAFAHPMPKPSISSPFGRRHGRAHMGTDFQAPIGTPIKAAAPGKIVNASMSGAYGNLIEIDHGNGILTRYAHCSAIGVRLGQTVKRGQVIGKVGNTGRSTGPHLHFELMAGGAHFNPANYLPTPGKRTTRTVVMRRGLRKVSEL